MRRKHTMQPRADDLHANADNGLEAKLENEQTASRSRNSLVSTVFVRFPRVIPVKRGNIISGRLASMTSVALTFPRRSKHRIAGYMQEDG